MVVYICPRCACQHKTIDSLSAHMTLKHSSYRFETVYCTQNGCSRICNDAYSFKKHLKSAHSAAVRVMPPPLHIPFVQNAESYNFSSELNVMTNDKSSGSEKLQNENGNIYNVSELKTALTESSSTFIAKMYCNPNITKAAIQDIVSNTTELFNSCFVDILKKVYANSIKNRDEKNFYEILNAISNPFENLETEYKREKYLEKSGYLIRPSAFVIGTKSHAGNVCGSTIVELKKVTAQIIPLRSVLKNFLQLPNVFITIESYMNDCLNDEKLSSFCNGRLWLRQKKNFPGKFVIPLMLFFDDLELNNPLGSHKGINKIGVIYCRLLAIPPQYSSMGENIFVVQFHKSRHLHEFGNSRIFTPLVEELKYLENTGISVMINGTKQKVFFTLSSFGGDNLGIHTVFGFHESFRSNFYCHLCRLSRNYLEVATYENSSELRTRTNFEKDLKEQSHGIKNASIFHELPNFHITENIYCDVMHDILEGICRYVIAKVSNILINVDQLFTLNILNNRIKFFHNGSAQRSNFLPIFSQEILTKGMLICSASEMKLLLENLGFIIGDLVPENNAAWELYITLREIQCLLMKNCISNDELVTLRDLIAQHHRLYQKVTGEPLKPKFHFLTHYPRVILNNGPIYDVSCMRFEAKHKKFKENAKVIRSRKNICFSLAMRNQLSFAERLQAKKGFTDRLKFGAAVKIIIDELPNYDLFKIFISKDQIKDYDSEISFAEINGTIYKSNMALIINESKNNSQEFGKIIHILVNDRHEVAFLLLKLRIIQFNKHIHAFEVEETTEWCMRTHTLLSHYKPRYFHNLANGKSYVQC